MSAHVRPVRPLTDEHRARVEANIQVAQRVATAFRKMLPHWVDAGELLSAAYEGLCSAARDWDPTRTEDFERFAVNRCWNYVLDGLRATDWMSRMDRQRHKAFTAAREQLITAGTDDPTPDQVLDALGVAHASRQTWLRSASILRCPFDETMDEVLTVADVEEQAERTVLTEHLRVAVTQLSDRHQHVFRRVFEDEAPHADVASELQVTASRISQMCRELETQLRVVMGVDAA